MNDDWKELMPDIGEGDVKLGEALADVALFLAEVLLKVLILALTVGFIAYAIWREWAIISFLMGQ